MSFRSCLCALALAVTALHTAPQAAAQDAADRISNYLNSIDTLRGGFVQIAPDGVISEGAFYLNRPGRLRFEYDRPSETIVIADGSWVAVLDEKDDQEIDRTLLSRTPLYLLLKKDVDLGAEGAIKSVEEGEGQLRVVAVDPSEEDSGQITMVFTDNPLELKQWIVTDAQGLTTTIALRTSQTNVDLPNELFVIPSTNLRE